MREKHSQDDLVFRTTVMRTRILCRHHDPKELGSVRHKAPKTWSAWHRATNHTSEHANLQAAKDWLLEQERQTNLL